MSNIKLFDLKNKKNEWIITLLSSSFASGASIALLVTSTWLIVTASLKPPILTLTVAVVSVRFFGISRGVFRYIERYASHNLVLKEIQDLRISLWQKLRSNIKNSYTKLNRTNVVNTLIRDLDGIQDIWLRALIPWASGALIISIVLIWLSILNWRVGLVFFISYVLAGIIFPLLINRVSINSTKKIPDTRANLFSLVNQQLSSMSEIVTLNLQKESLNSFMNQNNKLVKAENKKSFVSGLGLALILMTIGFSVIFIYNYSVKLNLENIITPATIAIFTLISLGVFEVLAMIPNTLQSWNQGNAAASRINEITKTNAFERYILNPKEIKISSKDFVAVIGPSGSGKSTFLNSILGLINEPVSLEIDDKKLDSNIDIDSEKELFAVLSDSYLFDTSVRENLLLSNHEATESEIWDALNKVGMKESIESLDKKLESFVGQNGAFFSGGERQRLLLARIFLSKAKIILIDEPTEHLDEKISKQVFESIKELSKNKTIIFTTHKESEYKQATKIIYIKDRTLVLN